MQYESTAMEKMMLKAQQVECLDAVEAAVKNILPDTDFLGFVTCRPSHFMSHEAFANFIEWFYAPAVTKGILKKAKSLKFLADRGYPEKSYVRQEHFKLSPDMSIDVSSHPSNYVTVFNFEDGTTKEVVYSIDELSTGEVGEIFVKSFGEETGAKGFFHNLEVSLLELIQPYSEEEEEYLDRIVNGFSALVNLNAGVNNVWPIWYPVSLLFRTSEERQKAASEQGFPYPGDDLANLIKDKITKRHPELITDIEAYKATTH